MFYISYDHHDYTLKVASYAKDVRDISLAPLTSLTFLNGPSLLLRGLRGDMSAELSPPCPECKQISCLETLKCERRGLWRIRREEHRFGVEIMGLFSNMLLSLATRARLCSKAESFLDLRGGARCPDRLNSRQLTARGTSTTCMLYALPGVTWRSLAALDKSFVCVALRF